MAAHEKLEQVEKGWRGRKCPFLFLFFTGKEKRSHVLLFWRSFATDDILTMSLKPKIGFVGDKSGVPADSRTFSNAPDG
jgi:hypothetical protein